MTKSEFNSQKQAEGRSQKSDDVALFWVQDGAGQLIEFGSVAQIFESPQHALTAAYVTGRRG